MQGFDIKNYSTLREAVSKPSSADSPCSACSVRHLTVCSALEEWELRDVSEISQVLEIAAGSPLFDEGEKAANVYNVTAGTLKIYKLLSDGRRQITGFLFPGDFVGLANDSVYAYSAESVTPCTVCRFPRRKLEPLLDKYPKMERRLLGMASHELATAQEQMLLLGRKTAKEKIASFLLSLSQRARDRGQPGTPIAVPMSRTDIGDFLGLTTETVSRTFTQLRSAGHIVSLPGGKIDVPDLAHLHAISEGL
jgi:CRP/FNR family transcriptional regulator